MNEVQRYASQISSSYKLWSCDQICDFLSVIGMNQYRKVFTKNAIAGDVIDDLTLDLLKDIGISALGDRIRIMNSLKTIKSFYSQKENGPYCNDNHAESLNSVNAPLTQEKTPTVSKKQKPSSISIKSGPAEAQFLTDNSSSDTKSPLSPLSFGNKSGSLLSASPVYSSFFGSFSLSKQSSSLTAQTSASQLTIQSSPVTLHNEQDVMSLDKVKSTCIRVIKDEHNSHIINIQNLTDVAQVRAKVFKKFGIVPDLWKEYAMFCLNSDGNPSLLDDDQLWDICKSDPPRHERQRLILQKVFHMKDSGKKNHQQLLKNCFKKLDSIMGGSISDDVLKQEMHFPQERPSSQEIAVNMEHFFPELFKSTTTKQSWDVNRPMSLSDNYRSRLLSDLQLKTRSNSLFTLELADYDEDSDAENYVHDEAAELPVVEEEWCTDISRIADAFNNNQIEDGPTGEHNFALGNVIGKGKCATVFYGVNLENQQIMAVKQVVLGSQSGLRPQHQKQKKEMAEMLKKEIYILQSLDHDNIVKCLGHQFQNGVLTMLMEYVSGGSIASLVARQGPLNMELCRSYASQIVNGLIYLHEQGIIHRDIKGANILVTSDDIIKISDFGVSKLVDQVGVDQRCSVKGSVFWMCPELVTRNYLTTKVDVWSLGCVVIEMATGRRPWMPLDPMQAMYCIGNGKLTPYTYLLERGDDTQSNIQLLKTCDAACSFIDICTQVDPTNRPYANELISHQFLHMVEQCNR
ncbi:hypothetical protein MIR68_009523 [Amoeboaphelidium protococcarum]|nr:hypothetical protein MIR68_009523 [Amoeboaphelidium protococcarum]